MSSFAWALNDSQFTNNASTFDMHVWFVFLCLRLVYWPELIPMMTSIFRAKCNLQLCYCRRRRICGELVFVHTPCTICIVYRRLPTCKKSDLSCCLNKKKAHTQQHKNQTECMYQSRNDRNAIQMWTRAHWSPIAIWWFIYMYKSACKIHTTK